MQESRTPLDYAAVRKEEATALLERVERGGPQAGLAVMLY